MHARVTPRPRQLPMLWCEPLPNCIARSPAAGLKPECPREETTVKRQVRIGKVRIPMDSTVRQYQAIGVEADHQLLGLTSEPPRAQPRPHRPHRRRPLQERHLLTVAQHSLSTSIGTDLPDITVAHGRSHGTLHTIRQSRLKRGVHDEQASIANRQSDSQVVRKSGRRTQSGE